MPFFSRQFGNAASRSHAYGQAAFHAVEKARAQIAQLVGARPHEVIFTSGATESNNLAIKGLVRSAKNHVITLATEHKSVLDPCKRLAMSGHKVTVLPVQSDGLADLAQLERAITSQTVLISIMLANNEIGVIQPAEAIGRMARKRGILFHCDGAQALGKIPIHMKRMGLDLLSITAHKVYGPKGVGALIVREGVMPVPLIDGGGHERGLRSGTLNVPGIVGFGKACAIGQAEMSREFKRLLALRDRLKHHLLKIKGVTVNGSLEKRLPNNLNVSFEGIPAQELLKRLKGVALSSGSACLSTSPEPSYVLKAIGVTEDLRRGAVRFGLGRWNTVREVDWVSRKIYDIIAVLRGRKYAVNTGRNLKI